MRTPTPETVPALVGEQRALLVRARRRRVHGVLLALVSATMFASQSIATKLALNAGATPLMTAASRCLLAATVLWILARAVMRFPMPDPRRMLRLVGLGIVAFGSEAILVAEALARLPAGTVILIVYTYPAMLFLLALALRTERASLAGVFAVVASFAGIALVVRGPGEALNAAGVALALSAALATAFLAFGSERLMSGVSLTVVGAAVLTGASAALLVAGGLSRELGFVPRGDAVGWMALQGLVLLPVGIWSYVHAISLIGASKTAIADTFGPVVALIQAAALLGDRPTAGQLGGAALVIAALVVLMLGRERRVTVEVAPSHGHGDGPS